jgi:hypothetical protein
LQRRAIECEEMLTTKGAQGAKRVAGSSVSFAPFVVNPLYSSNTHCKMEIRVDDLRGADIARLLEQHLQD